MRLAHMIAPLALLAAVIAGGLSAQPAAARVHYPADVSIALRPTTAGDLGSGSRSVPIIISNGGDGPATNIDLTMPLNTAAGPLIDAQFSAGNAWVTDLKSDRLSARILRIERGDSVTLTLRYTASGSGPLVNDRVSFSWEDEVRGGNGTSNPPPEEVQQAPDSAAPPTPAATPAAAPAPIGAANDPLTVIQLQGRRLLFTSTIFTPGEPVALWYNAPDGSAVPLLVQDNRELVLAETAASKERPRGLVSTTVTTGSTGTIALTFDASGLPSGSYTMVAHGTLSGFTAVAAFQP